MKRIVITLLALLLACSYAQGVPSLRLIGEYIIPNGTVFEGTAVGGISGLDYNAATDTYWLLSDDRSEEALARAYTAELEFDADSFDAVNLTSVVTLLQPDGTPFPERGVDPESLRVADDSFYWGSEGQNSDDGIIAPFVWETALDGSFIRALDVPEAFLPVAGQEIGVRNNLGFEAMALSPDGTTLLVANENSLLQDGPISSLTDTGVARITRYDLATGDASGMFAYVVSPIPAAPEPVEDFADNGLSDMLAVSDTQLLALERSYASGFGNANRIYLIDISGATDISGLESLEGQRIAPVRKQLVLDLTTLGVRIDNHEAMTFGPELPNGNRSLIVVSDNNFNDSQITQFLVFEVQEP